MSLLFYLKEKYKVSLPVPPHNPPEDILFFSTLCRLFEDYFLKNRAQNEVSSFSMLVLYMDELLQKYEDSSKVVTLEAFYGAFFVAMDNVCGDIHGKKHYFALSCKEGFKNYKKECFSEDLYQRAFDFFKGNDEGGRIYFLCCKSSFLNAISNIPSFSAEKLLFKNISFEIPTDLAQRIKNVDVAMICLAVLQLVSEKEKTIDLLNSAQLETLLKLSYPEQIRWLLIDFLSSFPEFWTVDFFKGIIFDVPVPYLLNLIDSEIQKMEISKLYQSQMLKGIFSLFYYEVSRFIADLYHLAMRYSKDSKAYRDIMKLRLNCLSSLKENIFFEFSYSTLSDEKSHAKSQLEREINDIHLSYKSYLKQHPDDVKMKHLADVVFLIENNELPPENNPMIFFQPRGKEQQDLVLVEDPLNTTKCVAM